MDERSWEEIKMLFKTVYGNGDSVGLDENMRTALDKIEGLSTKFSELATELKETNKRMASRSDVKLIMTMIMIQMGYVHDPEKALRDVVGTMPEKDRPKLIKYSAKDHPRRRAEDNDKHILSPIMKESVRVIAIGVVLWLFTDILPRIFSVTVPPP